MDAILDEKNGVLLVMLDLSTAVNTLDHAILLNRLEDSVGVEDVALMWLESYLADCHQSVHIKDAVSEKVKVRTGVSRGRFLAPCSFWCTCLPSGISSRDMASVDVDMQMMASCTLGIPSWSIVHGAASSVWCRI